MDKRILEAVFQVAKKIEDMPKEEFNKLLEEHKDGVFAKIFEEMNSDEKLRTSEVCCKNCKYSGEYCYDTIACFWGRIINGSRKSIFEVNPLYLCNKFEPKEKEKEYAKH